MAQIWWCCGCGIGQQLQHREHPYAMGMTLKDKKDKKKKKLISLVFSSLTHVLFRRVFNLQVFWHFPAFSLLNAFSLAIILILLFSHNLDSFLYFLYIPLCGGKNDAINFSRCILDEFIWMIHGYFIINKLWSTYFLLLQRFYLYYAEHIPYW